MIKSGLVSVTFRQLSPDAIIDLVSQSGLSGIEWGGDVHVPHGDIANAEAIRRKTLDAGLEVAAYGSYYRAGSSEDGGLPFSRVLETALALGAPTIRVWAGGKDSVRLTISERDTILNDLRRIGKMASAAGLSVSLEYHRGTLTDTRDSVRQLLKELSGTSVQFYWQPPLFADEAECLASVNDILPQISNVHVFHWRNNVKDELERRPLSDGAAAWEAYFSLLNSSGGNHYALLEFVRDDNPAQFLEDALSLSKILKCIES